jgi:hypothetical protein
MDRISAAENLIIKMRPDHWRLLVGGGTPGAETVLVEAINGQPLLYASEFATSRRMPRNGELPAEYISQVVLGWSQDDKSWHLGLLLASDLAAARKSRWCALAHWPDPDGNVFIDLAQQAGTSLANALGRPFHLVPMRRRPSPAPPPEPPLPELPLTLGTWTLQRRGSASLQLIRSPRWSVSRLTRATWYTSLSVVYVVLSTATLNTDLALPNAGTMLPSPELLPYLGLAVAIMLIIMTLYIVYELIARPDRIVIDGERGRIVALRGSRKRWALPREQLQALYVTQVVNRRGKKRKVYHGEINFLQARKRFLRLIEQPEHEEPRRPEHEESAEEAVTSLTPFDVQDNLQAAGLHIARTLGDLPAWYDQRIR